MNNNLLDIAVLCSDILSTYLKKRFDIKDVYDDICMPYPIIIPSKILANLIKVDNNEIVIGYIPGKSSCIKDTMHDEFNAKYNGVMSATISEELQICLEYYSFSVEDYLLLLGLLRIKGNIPEYLQDKADAILSNLFI